MFLNEFRLLNKSEKSGARLNQARKDKELNIILLQVVESVF